ncbi:hypothetical protein ACLIYP_11970 [Streptomyces nanhaiensis]|uniref:hypothetical protein n=1 Tax=Streptomyces nanhaiensis TaxID=679319 RepID=UPI00399C6802
MPKAAALRGLLDTALGGWRDAEWDFDRLGRTVTLETVFKVRERRFLLPLTR